VEQKKTQKELQIQHFETELERTETLISELTDKANEYRRSADTITAKIIELSGRRESLLEVIKYIADTPEPGSGIVDTKD